MNPDYNYSFEEILYNNFFDLYEYDEIQLLISARIDNDPSFAKSYAIWLKANNYKSWRDAYDDPKPLTSLNSSDDDSSESMRMESDLLDIMFDEDN